MTHGRHGLFVVLFAFWCLARRSEAFSTVRLGVGKFCHPPPWSGLRSLRCCTEEVHSSDDDVDIWPAPKLHTKLRPRFLYQNDELFVVDKPAGMSFHSEFEDGVVATIRKMQGQGKIPYDGEIHSVHRLDRLTSGLLIFAKSQRAASTISAAGLPVACRS